MAIGKWGTFGNLSRTQGDHLGFGCGSIHSTFVDGKCGCVSNINVIESAVLCCVVLDLMMMDG